MKESRTYGRTVSVEVKVYGECKYSADEEVFKNSKKVRYDGVVGWDIVSGFEAFDEIERFTDASCIDYFHEYLVLHFEDGEAATFRNSFVDMFRVR